jgi:DNA-binding MurR/RpiR family transcriptional regulator
MIQRKGTSTEAASALINRRYAGLSAGHRRVADFILGSPHEAALMTLEELASATGVSVATANRFGSKLGLAGHAALKRLLKTELQQALKPVQELVATIRVPGLSQAAPWTRSLEENIRQIGSVKAADGDQTFARAANMLASARRAFMIGFGSSSFVASYGAFNLAGLRDQVEAVTDTSGLEGAQRRLLGAGPTDVALLVGFARYSAPAVRLADQLARRGVPQIAVTDSSDSPFAARAEVAIVVERKRGFVLSGAGAAGLAVIEALLQGVAANIGAEKIEARLAQLTATLGDTIIGPVEDLTRGG